jgi:hypothetical protein
VTDDSKGLKDLAPFEALGLAYGAGPGFFVFPRPGFPRDLPTAGHLPDLFLLPWSELGIAVEASRFPHFQGLPLGNVAVGQNHQNATALL